MPPRLRSLIGSIAILAFLVVYVWLATLVASRLPEKRWVWLIFYAVVGTAWGAPILPLLSWIAGKPKRSA
jgi:hypothetical protein